jgi:hypothetical protein
VKTKPKPKPIAFYIAGKNVIRESHFSNACKEAPKQFDERRSQFDSAAKGNDESHRTNLLSAHIRVSNKLPHHHRNIQTIYEIKQLRRR